MPCIVIGTLKNPDGSPYVGPARFTPLDGHLKTVPHDLLTASGTLVEVTDGDLEVELMPGTYQVLLRGAQPGQITVPTSGQVDIINILTGGVGLVTPAVVGIPAGGTAGQVLAKQTDTDYNADWEDPAGGTGAGLPTGGTTGQVLTKQSEADGDADWETLPAGGGAVTSVAGRTGDVVLAAADVGLGNVNNTADADKPISDATATALAGKAATSHTHAQADVTNLVSDLAGKAATSHTHAQADVTNLVSDLSRVGQQPVAQLTADTFAFPNSNWTNYSQLGEFSTSQRTHRYLMDASREEPVLFPTVFRVPDGATSLKFTITYYPEATCDGTKVAWKVRRIAAEDNAAWSGETAVELGADTLPSSGQNPQVYAVSKTLAELGLSVGQWVQIWLARDATHADDTFAPDVGLYAAMIECVR